MADKKYYLSKIRHKGKLLNVKDEEARAGLLVPVDISTLTPASTFRKNAVIGINGVLYRAKKDTARFPVTLVTDDATGAFVVDIVNGRQAFVIDNPTVHEDWEQWTDSGLEHSFALLDSRKLELGSTITVDGREYTVGQLLQAVASLMTKTIVVDG